MSWRTYLKDVKVLIVDDQDFLRSLVRSVLRVLGCKHLSEAANVETAWETLFLNKPDLVILDWEMDWGEGMDGIELARMIRQNEQSPDKYLPIIMLTAHSELSRITAARDAGVTEFVTKPISAGTFLSRLNEVIEHPRMFIRTDDFFGPDRRRKNIPVAHDRRISTENVNITEIENHGEGRPAKDNLQQNSEINARGSSFF